MTESPSPYLFQVVSSKSLSISSQIPVQEAVKVLGKFYECNKEREFQRVFLVSGVRKGIQHIGLFTSKSMEKACAGLETVIAQELYCIALPTAPPLTMKLIHGLVKNNPVQEEVTVELKSAPIKNQKQVLITKLMNPSISKNLDLDKAVFYTSGSGSFDPNNINFDECDDEELCKELNSVEDRMGIAIKKTEVYSNTKIQDYMIKLHQPSKPSEKWLRDLERDFQTIEEEIIEEESFLLAELAKAEEGSVIKEGDKLVEASCKQKVNIEHLELSDTFDTQNRKANEDTQIPKEQLLDADMNITN